MRAATTTTTTTGSRTTHVRAMVTSLLVRQLQIVLGDLNLARSGLKHELIDRIVQALEQFELKATENSSNHATSAYYNDQLTAGLRSIEAQVQARRPGAAHAHYNHSSGGLMTPPSSGASTPTYAARGPPPPPNQRLPPANMHILPPQPHIPMPYGRPIPFNSHTIPPPPPHHHHQQLHHRHPHHQPPPHHHNQQRPPVSITPLLNDLLRPETPASLHGARCFCGVPPSATASAKVISCASCALTVHAKCHQLVATQAEGNGWEWHCETCRAKLCDPFLRVKKNILSPVFVKFNRNQVPFRIEYTISDQDLNDLYAKRDAKPGAMTAGCVELQLRVFALKEELGTGTSWPTTSVISANNFNLPLVQRAPPGQSNPSKVLREQPANLFPFSRVGRNVIEVRTSENPLIFAFMVQIVEFRNVNELVDEVRLASASWTYEDAKKQVIKSFGGSDGEEDDDDGIETTSTILSVRCPLGLCVINLPARGVACKHLQCFDLKTFLLFNKKARSRHYRCTVCHNFIKASDLRIDPYLKKLLRDVQGDDDLEEVEILPDASWKKRTDNGDGGESDPPPAKRVKTEPNTSTTVAAEQVVPVMATIPPPAQAQGSANAPFEIDLSLSSDDEDDDDGGDTGAGAVSALLASTSTSSSSSTSTSTSATTAPSSSSSAAFLDDDNDDVAIFTVDSDVWETDTTTTASSAGNGTTAASLVPFPLDLFASFSSNGSSNNNHVDLVAPSSSSSSSSGSSASSSNGHEWTSNTSSSALPSLTAVSSTTSSTGGTTTTTVTSSASAASTESSSSDLASAMAVLSRNHPHVSNPFEAQQQQQANGPKQVTQTVSVSSSSRRRGGEGGGGGGGMLDVICLLDSDSD